MTTSINTNVAAYYAQANIAAASNAATESVARLSSGNAIVQASDNVAALATGTSLATQVGALKTAQTNASQGSSLLQVADGALAQIQSILQQQQSLALQAQSGSLTDTVRGFLNQQFASLNNEINSLATGTTFNGVGLIDGSLATGGSNNPLTNNATPAAGSLATVAGFTKIGANITAAAMIQATAAPNGITGTAADTAFEGALSGGTFSVTYGGAANKYVIAYTINGQTYTSGLVDTSATGGHINLFNMNSKASNSSAGMIQITTAADIHATYTAAADAVTLQNDLTTAFSGATAYAVRTVATVPAKDANNANIAGSAIQATDTAGTLLDGFTGANVKVSSTDFSGNNLPPVSDFTATGTGSSTVFSVLVNGVTYSTQGTVAPDGSSTLVGSTFDGTAGVLKFYKAGDKTDNPNDFVQLDFAGAAITNSAKIATTADVNSITDSLNTLFGSGGAAGGLTFQLGTTATSNVSVNIGSAQTSALYDGASLDISTQGGATTAAATVGTAINTVTSLRAGVGALESQFNFASSALQSSVQNQDAARGDLLDTDISTESTSYATDQVKLQAGISVLAQANQSLQALLKLIG